MRKHPLNDDAYTGNDEQIEDLKELVGALHECVQLAHDFLDSLPNGWLGKTTGDVGALNDFYIKSKPILKGIEAADDAT